MNKIVLNNHGNNYNRVKAQGNIKIPSDEAEQIRWCKAIFDDLKASNNATCLFSRVNSKKGFMFSVWELSEKYFLTMSLSSGIRDENNTPIYVNTFIVSDDLNDKNDFVAIAKCLSQNFITIGNNYIKQINDIDKYRVSENVLADKKKAPN